MINELANHVPESGTKSMLLNPFYYRFSVKSPYNILKIIFMTICVVPFRIIGVMLFLSIGYILCCIGSYGLTLEDLDRAPLTGWRAKIRWPLYFMGRMMIRCYGFMNVKIKGKMASRDEAPILVVAPHSSFFDGIIIWWCKAACPSFVTRSENSNIPIIGKSIDYVQPVRVTREHLESRQDSIEKIKQRVYSELPWKQLVVFPEGTCTNRSCLITFKHGAFIPGVPVQPVILRYPNKTNCFPWTWDGPGALKIIWIVLCQFINYCQIEYLPVYYPNDEEKKNSKLYASNVRDVMASALQLPVADFTYDDCKIMQKVKNKKLPTPIGLVKFQQIRQRYGVDLKTVQTEILDRFAELANRNGEITVMELAEKLDVSAGNKCFQDVFQAFDTKLCGILSLRDYIIGTCEIYRDTNTHDNLRRIFFELFDSEREQHVTAGHFMDVLLYCLSISPAGSTSIFRRINNNQKGFIKFDDFQEFIKREPEYGALLYLYMKDSESS